jgi:anti-sigma factor RsiW
MNRRTIRRTQRIFRHFNKRELRMNTNKLSPDDPRLTAYALGEMEPDESAEIARLLQEDPAACAAVEEIRSTANLLGAALRDEPAPVSAPASAASAGTTRRVASDPKVRWARVLRFPQLYFYISGLAAACFAVFFGLYESREAARAALLAGNPVVVTGTQDEVRSAYPAGQEGNMVVAARAAPASGLLPLVEEKATLEDRFFPTAEAATSTFPLRVGRESYDAVRALLRRGLRPARASVQVAEMINAFTYTWPQPADGDAFASVLEETEAPWAPEHRLVRIGLKARAGLRGPVADDARVVVDFNPARVLAWRLVGFERDGGGAGVRGGAGETVQPGDAVTVLYELVPVAVVAPGADRNLLRMALTYREPASGDAQLFERTLPAGGTSFAAASPDMKFATAVAAFGLRLRESSAQAPVSFGEIEQWARAGGGDAERTEFVGLVRSAETIVR